MLRDRPLLAALIVALVLRLGWIFLYPQVPVRGDDVTYVGLAKSMLAGEGYKVGAKLETHYMPGWPVVLTGVFGLGLGMTGGRILQCLLSTLICLFAYQLGERLVSRRAGLAAAWFGALFPPLIWYCGVLLGETPSAALLGLWAVCSVRYVQEGGGWRRIAALGALSGVLVLFRAEMLVCAPLPFVARALVSPWRKQLLPAAAAVALTLAALSPWVAYNQQRFGETILLTTAGGIGLLNVGRDQDYGYDEYYATLASLQVPGKPKATDRAITAHSRQDIARNPGSYLRRRLTNLPRFLFGSQTEPVAGAEATIAEARRNGDTLALFWKALGFATQTLFAVAALVGLVLFARRRDRLFPWLVIGAKVAAHAAFIQSTRYSLHLAPLLLCYAGATLAWLAARRAGAAAISGAEIPAGSSR